MRRASVVCVALLAACTSAPENLPSTSTSPPRGSTASQPASESRLTCWQSDPPSGSGPIELIDVTESAGLVEPLTGMHGHAAMWTDIDGDDVPDLYFGTFADRPDDIYQQRGAVGPAPDRLLRGDGSEFADVALPEMRTRTSGGASADLDNDGDLDIVVSRNIKDVGLGQSPTIVLENVDGTPTPREETGIPADLGGRSVAVLDYDQDGLVDVFIVEDRFTGGSSRLFRNLGGLQFEDSTAESGLPTDIHGLGVAVADYDGDGTTDLFVSGSNRLFLASNGEFIEADNSVFEWETYGNEDDVAGVSVADVNRDGLIDIAIGHHFNSTVDFGQEVSVRLYLNEGEGRFRDVTEAAGLTPLPTKAPHVEFADLDNDGWPDLLTSASDGPGPAIFRHTGLQSGIPTFSTPDGLGEAQYWVAAPTTDYDADGRLDVLLVEWEPALPSLLLHNESEGGNWLEVSVGASHDFGVNWLVEIHDGDQLIGARPITVTEGYSAGVLPRSHFGLGDITEVSVRLTGPGGEPVTIDEVAANQHIRWPDGCG